MTRAAHHCTHCGAVIVDRAIIVRRAYSRAYPLCSPECASASRLVMTFDEWHAAMAAFAAGGTS